MASSRSLFFVVLAIISICASEYVFENVTVQLSFYDAIIIENVPVPVDILIKQDNSLEKYVTKYSHDLNAIVIKNQNVPELRENSINNLNYIQQISIVSSGVKVIYPGAFKNLTHLKLLDLSNNLLEEIKFNTFRDLHSIQIDFFKLERNRISKIEDRAFVGVKALSLCLNQNQLSTWKSSWFDGLIVECMGFIGNLLEELPEDAFHFVDKSSTIDEDGYRFCYTFDSNKIKSIHSGAFKGFKTIPYVALANNTLDHLDKRLFENVSTIYMLDLNKNKFRNFDLDLLKNTQVYELYIEDNQLDCISTDIYNVAKIYTIRIAGNPLTCECVKMWEEWIKEYQKPDIMSWGPSQKEKCLK